MKVTRNKNCLNVGAVSSRLESAENGLSVQSTRVSLLVKIVKQRLKSFMLSC